MTFASLLEKGREMLKAAEVDNYSNEARWIFESVFDCSSGFLILNAENEADEIKAADYLKKVSLRASGVPVQYVIGEWDFFGETFSVGEGVLIPRPETELLVEFALEYLKDKEKTVVVDLCAGSGCIGLSVAKNLPLSKVYLIEKSPEAFRYLSENKERLGCGNAEIIRGDIFNGFEAFDLLSPDLILSNPPYIESEEIGALQSEVKKEPLMALDGGEDGLIFYKAIASEWLGYCKGAIAVECGENQSDAVKNIFSEYCVNIKSVSDFNGIERVVCGTLKKGNKNAF